MESVWVLVGKDGILDFTWQSPSGETIVKEEQTALLPFEEIASIANTMLPVVIVGPKSHSLVDLDHINGFDTKMDVEITKVSLTLMRIRDKGSLQGTIVPVWDFWGTWDWYDAEPNAYGYNEKGMNYTTGPMLTLNAIDGTVVSREFGTDALINKSKKGTSALIRTEVLIRYCINYAKPFVTGASSTLPVPR